MGKRINPERVQRQLRMRIGLIIAPSLADMGSFLFELKYPSNLKRSSDEFFLFCSLPFLLTQGTVTSTLRAFFNR